MKIHVGWLREHVDAPESPPEIGRRLTSLGFALDGIENADAGDDAVLDLDVGSNRPDALSHVGMARELAAATGRALRLPASLPDEDAEDVDSFASVEVRDADLCPRYAARVVRGVGQAASPAWMTKRLEACGIRPIGVLVDVTNYVLLELGHPLHAFDADRLAGRRIVVRRAAAGERMTTLDGVPRTFEGDELLIADAERGVAVAGVMGGADSEIAASTRDVLIESAYFDPASIRRTSKRLGLHTEASHRFERGADVDAVPRALDRCASLVAQLAGGRVLSGVIDVGGALPARREVVLRRARIEHLCGIEIPDAVVERTLAALGFEIARSGGDGWLVRVPRARGDVSREVDLVEEVLRHHGYDKVPRTLPPFRAGSSPRAAWEDGLVALRRTLVGSGYHQAITFSFDDPALMATWGASVVADAPQRLIPLANPMAENQGVLRTSLVPALLRAASNAARRGEDDVRLFEDGTLFLRRAAAGPSPAEERRALALVAMGRRGPAHFMQHAPPVDVLGVEGALVESLVAAGAERATVTVAAADVPRCAPGSADVLLSGRRIGWIGRIHPGELEAFEMAGAVFAAEVDLTDVLPTAARRRTFVPPSRYPKVVRDLCVLVDVTSRYDAIIAAVGALPAGDSAPIESFELIDRHVGPGVPQGKVSLTFSVAYRSNERTLTKEEVDRRHAQVVETLARAVGAVLRT